jgi:UPF0755 protein
MTDNQNELTPRQPEENDPVADEMLRWREIGQENIQDAEAPQAPETPEAPEEESAGPDFDAEPPFELPYAGEDWDGGEEDSIEPRDYRPVRPRRDGKLGCLGGLMYATFVIALSIVLACVAWLFASDVLALNKEPVTATITIPKSIYQEKDVEVEDADGEVTTETMDVADIGYVAHTLKSNGIIQYEFLFRLFAKISHADRQIDPGTYELNTNYDYRALVKKMQVGSGSQVETTITFPEGYTLEQIFQKLEDNDVCSKESLYDAAANYDFSYAFLEGTQTGDANRLEGFLFPDTYNFYQGMQASGAINKFLTNFHYKITADMWNTLEKKSMTFQQLVTVASMIEKEAADDDERPIIASVIYNRLAADMPLGIDATIQYFLPEHVAVITSEQLQIDNPYNTYMYKGLPPGPICNPGMPSINAALSPATTGYYYYALDMESKKHKFFKTAAEQAAFVATQDYSKLS